MNPLDHVIWHALTTRQAAFAQGSGIARRFVAEVGPLAACPEKQPDDKGYDSLAELAGAGGAIGLFLNERYVERKGWETIAEAPLWQMVRKNPGAHETPANDADIIPLGAADSADMIELTSLVKPGPFRERTHELGSFYGIRAAGKLVAMAGERLQVPGYTEVSAVCTHPDHNGKGYAAALMRRVVAGIEQRGDIPFLHVRGDNGRAIGLYERLGFSLRWAGHFAALRRQ